MPHTTRKNPKGGHDIVKKLPSGGTRKVGHSSSKKKAEASARIRDRKG